MTTPTNRSRDRGNLRGDVYGFAYHTFITNNSADQTYRENQIQSVLLIVRKEKIKKRGITKGLGFFG